MRYRTASQLKFFGTAALAATGFHIGVDQIDKHAGGRQQYYTAIERATVAAERFRQVHGIPGLSIGVSIDGGETFSWKTGLGWADVENMTRCDGNAVMRIASISKPITAAVTMQLVEQGKLKLDDTVHAHLKDYPRPKISADQTAQTDITVKHLLTHQSGVRHYRKKDQANQGIEAIKASFQNSRVYLHLSR